jgi:hypothetical protein
MKNKKETFEKLHAKPVSRRDFLASGLLPFSASMFLPSFVNVFANAGVAEAQELVCKSAGAAGLCPFISIKLSGGAAISANFLPHDKARQLLKSYSKMGMGSGASVPVTYEFSNRAPFYANSQILAGIRTNTTVATLARSTFVGTCVRSQDDSSANKFDITGLVAKSGLNGMILPNLGRANTSTGINALPAYIAPPSPLVVGRFEDIPGSLAVGNSLALLNKEQQGTLFRTIQGLTSSQAEKLYTQSGGKTLSRLIQCANKDNSNLISNSTALNIDPLSNTAFATVWGINAQTSKSSQDFIFATMVYNALNGNAGTINLEMGGFDYHNGTRTSGDAKDLEAGTVIGNVLESLTVMGKKGFVVVTSDGSVTSPESDTAGGPWTSDRGTAGSTYMIGYDPAGAHEAKDFQIGHFNDGQTADDTFLTGGSAELAAGSMFANYMAFNGKANLIETYLPRVFTSADLDLILKFT